jgi:[ribosomal protein S5]-alanine N-acetyltransferase
MSGRVAATAMRRGPSRARQTIGSSAGAAWGHGYASELVAACTDVADRTLQLPELAAFAHPDNVASRRVLRKSGFEQVRFVPEMNRFLY